jgi:tungstate transport system substrate-binding protein
MRHLKGALKRRRRALLIGLAAVVALGLAGCSAGDNTRDSDDAEKSEVVLASTTSTEDSGLFDVLIPAFEDSNPEYAVKVIAVGTGEALELGRTKDADVLLVHAKADEETFVAEGYGVDRADVMYNDFLIVGPASDPAGVKSAADINVAMAGIASVGGAGKARWISRGDDSGTNKKELKLWAAAGVEPKPTPEADAWYEETGQGMGETLKIASEEGAYTLVDRATYLSMTDALDLEILMGAQKVAENEQDALLNQYGVIVVTDATNQAGGRAFNDWILSETGQAVIGDFGIEDFGQQLFVPNAK